MYKSLKRWHTFGLNVKCRKISIARSIESLCMKWTKSMKNREPVFILGNGSNTVFLEDFEGHVIINRIMGITVLDDHDKWYLHVNSGEDWTKLVEYTVENGYAGLENLAMIPGTVGAAPIQNIGAYGMELSSVCSYVEIVCLYTGKIKRIASNKCKFDYRSSIFKELCTDRYAVTGLGIELSKKWVPTVKHKELNFLSKKLITPYDLYRTVCSLRESKLPDPLKFGNVGSFFKNPIVNYEYIRKLQFVYSNVPITSYLNKKYVLHAWWLIEKCHISKFSSKKVDLYDKHKLILINVNNATGNDILSAAKVIIKKVAYKFKIILELEVDLIGSNSKVTIDHVHNES